MAAITNLTIVDDRDPGITCSYSTIRRGDTATYYFNGTHSFRTYGPITDLGPPVAVHQVDNAPARLPLLSPLPSLSRHFTVKNFWTSSQLSQLSPGNFHELIIIAVSQNDTPLWIDYLAYPVQPWHPSSPITASLTTSAVPTSASISSTSPIISKNLSAITAGITVSAIAVLWRPMQHVETGSYASVPPRLRTPEDLRTFPDATRIFDGGVKQEMVDEAPYAVPA
ncbi:hypothetical protein PAXRUDRAFT_30387 [Paxillus rubicundulus Ve08.2h10]|uniref:Uncharacterized protein n=1 Tax=Paxillus rubicundulus Ve08.2h10 TaxID=930991 RepID=A0A0D0DLT9_9AGAM|nr:hypothetical protein PAXRUDRAFT_30387 [Paxillus rubicundulus Ve08.2h10]